MNKPGLLAAAFVLMSLGGIKPSDVMKRGSSTSSGVEKRLIDDVEDDGLFFQDQVCE